MKKFLIVLLLALLAGCNRGGFHIRSTKGLILFSNNNCDICIVSSDKGGVIKVVPSGEYDWPGDQCWLNSKEFVYDLFYGHVTPWTVYPVYIHNLYSGKKAKVLNFDSSVELWDKFSNSSVLFSVSSTDIRLLDLTSKDTLEITDGYQYGLRRLVHVRANPTGEKLVFAGLDSVKYKLLPRYPSGLIKGYSDSLDDIYSYQISQKSLTRLTNTNCCDRDPTWAPDGKQIAFSSNRGGNFEIYVMDNNGSNTKRITENAAKDTDPEYSPEGDRIAFISNRSGKSQIWIMNADGSDARQLTNLQEGVTGPLSWSPAK